MSRISLGTQNALEKDLVTGNESEAVVGTSSFASLSFFFFLVGSTPCVGGNS